MKKIGLLLAMLTGMLTFAQKHNKGDLYVYWGWNNAEFTRSNIEFKGEGYDFTLYNVKAQDRPSPFSFKKYFDLGNMSIPQFNARIGYFFADNWNISIGQDHMKYVMNQDQVVRIKGHINDSGTPYDGQYNNDNIELTEDFLTFEHTDGLNYVNAEIRRFDNVAHLKILNSGRGIDFNLTEGLGAGILYPRTNTKLLGKDRYDEYHIAGYGVSAVAGLNVMFFNRFFIQSEFKGGYINMPDIRTTADKSDKAKQDFGFFQHNWVFGVVFHLNKKNTKLNF